MTAPVHFGTRSLGLRCHPATTETVERGRPVPAYPNRVTVHAPAAVITDPDELDAFATAATDAAQWLRRQG